MIAKRLELRDLVSVEWPTDAQCADFVEHLCRAHSWYKHLPFSGASFVVFVLGDAGTGFEQHDRMHYGWTRTDEYRRCYGLLDYAWQLPGEHTWSRDAGCQVEPSPELLTVAGFALHPTCSSDFNAIDVVCARYAEERPVDDELRLLHELNGAAEHAYHALERIDQEAAARDEDDTTASPRLYAYRELQARVDAQYASLRTTEVATISSAIDRLASALTAARRGR